MIAGDADADVVADLEATGRQRRLNSSTASARPVRSTNRAACIEHAVLEASCARLRLIRPGRRRHF